jgi:hypothetical protein
MLADVAKIIVRVTSVTPLAISDVSSITAAEVA